MKFTKIHKMGALLTATGSLFASLITATPVHATDVQLSVSSVQQIESNWCWAASDYAILSYYGYYNETQADIVNYIYGSTVNAGATDSQAQSALYHYGVSTNRYTGSLSQSTIYTQINANRPLYVTWTWIGQSTGHAVVLYGYDSSNTGSIYYMDPLYGENYKTTFTNFVNDGSHNWSSGLKDDAPYL